MLFKYKGVNTKGNYISSTIEASDYLDAKVKLKQKGILVKTLKKERVILSNNFFVRKINNNILSILSRDISIYLASGISLIKSIELLKNRFDTERNIKLFLESIYTFLNEGRTFYSALESQTVFNLPMFYKQSIKVSEANGLLEGVLLELSNFLKEQDLRKKQISSALVYPSFIFLISLVMVFFMLSVVVPQITSMFEKLGNELPLITTVVITLGDFFSSNYIFIFTLFFLIIGSFLYLKKTSPSFKYSIDLFLLKIPFVKSIIELNELSRFSHMNSILIRSGVPIVQSIKLSSNILNNSVLSEIFLNASKNVVEGERLSEILKKNKGYRINKSFIQALAIGEETSQLSSILTSLGQLYTELNKDKISIFLALLEPILMLFVGAIVGTIILAMLLPIFSMNI